MPHNPRLHVTYVGPEVTAHDARTVKMPRGRSSVTVSAYAVRYEDLLLVERPHLFLAQNAGLQHGPHFAEWKPTLHLLRERGLLTAVTTFDAGERVRSLKFLAAGGFGLRAASRFAQGTASERLLVGHCSR